MNWGNKWQLSLNYNLTNDEFIEKKNLQFLNVREKLKELLESMRVPKRILKLKKVDLQWIESSLHIHNFDNPNLEEVKNLAKDLLK